MKILFVGQRGIPIFGSSTAAHHHIDTSREKRVELIATQVAAQGHTVYAMCAKPFIFPSLRQYNGVELVHGGSVTYAGSVNIWHLVDAIFAVRTHRPDVVHAHGWRAGIMLRLMHVLHPHASYIWTIDTLPTRYVRLASWVGRVVSPICDTVTVPTRQLQYLLLHLLHIRTAYIPDGYMPAQIPPIELTRFGLRKGHYSVTTAQTKEDIRFAAQGYKRVQTKKPLVVMVSPTPSLQRMKRYFPFLTFIPADSDRVVSSLLSGAAVVIVAGKTTQPETLLTAMDGGRALVAITLPVYEEIIGVTGKFVRHGDSKALGDLVRRIVKSSAVQKVMGQSAQKRAQMHFSAARIVAEYMLGYRATAVRTISLDSAVPRLLSDKSPL